VAALAKLERLHSKESGGNDTVTIHIKGCGKIHKALLRELIPQTRLNRLSSRARQTQLVEEEVEVDIIQNTIIL